MPTVERLRHRGTSRARRANAALGEEFRQKRLAVGLSQRIVAAAAGLSRSTYTRIEAGAYEPLSIVVGRRICAVLGLDLSVRAYPGAEPLRDAAQIARLGIVLSYAAPPLASRTEVALPQPPAATFEQRAWDADLVSRGERTTMELEMRVTDGQALERRLNQKRRDDASDNFVLLLADTHHNRRVLRENPALFSDLERVSFTALVNRLSARSASPDLGCLGASRAARGWCSVAPPR
jgi:transcriptional regulator with XRE-family HTH domain